MGMEEEKQGLFPFLTPFPSSHRPPRAFYFSIIAILFSYPVEASAKERLCAQFCSHRKSERDPLPKLVDS